MQDTGPEILFPMPARQLPDRFLVAFSFAEEQRGFVRAVAEAVEKELGPGTVFLDEWFQYYIAGHDADLKLQSIYGEICELVVVCVSNDYDSKPWTQAEHEAVRSRLMKSRTSTNKRDLDRILPIRVGDGHVEGISFTTIVPDVRGQTADQVADLIIQRFRFIVSDLQAASTDSCLDPWLLEAPSSLIWPMADHNGVRDAFAALLTRSARWRFLPIRGPSETGKTYITNQMLANALQMPDLACGRFDFKGSIDMDVEVRAFVQELGVLLPPPSALLNERLARVLNAVLDRKRPTLLIFDTYEEAAKSQQDWVEKELLVRMIRAPWLRVVIAGQRVPESIGAVWNSVACATVDLKPPPPFEWFDFGRQYRPDLSLEDVETACRLAKDKASLLAQLLGPAI